MIVALGEENWGKEEWRWSFGERKSVEGTNSREDTDVQGHQLACVIPAKQALARFNLMKFHCHSWVKKTPVPEKLIVPVGQEPSWTYCVLAGQTGGGNQKFRFPCHWGYFQHFGESRASLNSRISFIPGIVILYFQGYQRHLFSTQGGMVYSLGQRGLKCEVMPPCTSVFICRWGRTNHTEYNQH